jgi:hypothetical protein
MPFSGWWWADPLAGLVIIYYATESGQRIQAHPRGSPGMNLWDTAAAVIGDVVLIYAVLLFLLALYARRQPETVGMKEALRLLPDLPTLLRRLTADRALSCGIRIRLILRLVHLASPIDLVPDSLPVIG